MVILENLYIIIVMLDVNRGGSCIYVGLKVVDVCFLYYILFFLLIRFV